MRLKKIKGAEDIINSSSYIILNPAEYNGHYHDLFLNKAPIKIEIGTGKGDFIINLAKQNPNINFIGIEKYDSVLVRVTQKLEKEAIPNLRLILMDALNIDKVFNQEIDTIYLNFSDPWPKKRHTNRRLTSPIFLEKYNHIFKSNNHIIMKTDNRSLFEYSLITLIDYNYKINNLSLDLYNSNHDNNIPTEYETRFIEMGKTIYMGEFIKERQ
jgi:tRNA (guanine-N7-)-methyltransferase